MNTKKFIKYNNELQNQLNKENKKKYEELLVKIRVSSFFKDEKKLEATLFEMLQDLIEHQKNGGTFEELFGNDIDSLTKNIVENSGESSLLEKFKFIFSIIAIYFSSTFLISIYDKNTLNIAEYLISNLFQVSIFLIAFILCINLLNKKSNYNAIIFIIFIGAMMLWFTPAIFKLTNFYSLISLEGFNIQVTNTFSIISFIVCATVILLAGLILQELFVAFLLIIPQIIILIASLISKTYAISELFLFLGIMFVILLLSFAIIRKNK